MITVKDLYERTFTDVDGKGNSFFSQKYQIKLIKNGTGYIPQKKVGNEVVQVRYVMITELSDLDELLTSEKC